MDITSTIVAAAQKYGVDPALAIEVGVAESGLNPNTPDSSAGAIGVMQLMPATAVALGVNPRDPAQNIDGGVRLLQQLLSRFPDISQALAAYNWTPSSVANAVAQYGTAWLAHAPAETQNYVQKILNALGTQYTVSAAPPPAEDATSDPVNSPTSFSASVYGDPTQAALADASWYANPIILALAGLAALFLFEEMS